MDSSIIRRLKSFTLINAPLILLGNLMDWLLVNQSQGLFLATVAIFAAKSVILLTAISFLTFQRVNIIDLKNRTGDYDKVTVNPENLQSGNHLNYDVMTSILNYSILEACTYHILQHMQIIERVSSHSKTSPIAVNTFNLSENMGLFLFEHSPSSLYSQYSVQLVITLVIWWIIFVLQSFIFELLFDFFHYWSHRFMHQNLFIYRQLHSDHHKVTILMYFIHFMKVFWV